MLRRLFVVLQYLGLIPILIFWFFWLIEDEYFWNGKPFTMFVLSLIPYGLIILGKWIIYGKFHIYKIGEGEENKLRDSSRKDDSEIGFTSKSDSNRDSYEPPFPDGF
jgi:hypothetical protein